MPGGDRTGPGGMGPMTGRGAGYCAGYDVPGYANPIPGGGRGGGAYGSRWWARGGGRGRRNWYYATGLPGYVRASRGMPAWGGVPYGAGYAPAMPKETELEMLKADAEGLTETLNNIKKRIEELESEGKSG
jgi:hypothetical protein